MTAIDSSDSWGGMDTRFVVLCHIQRDGTHFDLMIDTGAALATWKLAEPPEAVEHGPLACTRIGDHRTTYLDYEGPVSGDRGEVRRHDCGACTILSRRDDRWEIHFHGRRLSGSHQLLLTDPPTQGWSLRRFAE
jgi:hypothetical protein